MLRRKPTQITLTTEDIAIYEDKRARELAMEKDREAQEKREREILLLQQHQGNQNQRIGVKNPNHELKPFPGGKAPIERANKSAQERLGLARNGGSGSRS